MTQSRTKTTASSPATNPLPLTGLLPILYSLFPERFPISANRLYCRFLWKNPLAFPNLYLRRKTSSSAFPMECSASSAASTIGHSPGQIPDTAPPPSELSPFAKAPSFRFRPMCCKSLCRRESRSGRSGTQPSV